MEGVSLSIVQTEFVCLLNIQITPNHPISEKEKKQADR